MHLVDTLDAGGAERMCVQLANALARGGMQVEVCVTRRGGALERLLDPGVGLFRLERRHRWDAAALWRLRRYVREKGIEILHAHGTALFAAAAARAFREEVRLVWHVHAGALVNEQRNLWAYRTVRRWVDAVLSVNRQLAQWAVQRAGFPSSRVRVAPNFAGVRLEGAADGLPGAAGFRIVQVANVRPQKDHATMLRAMVRIVREEPRAHLLVVGHCDGVFGDSVRRLAEELGLGGHVSFLGAREDVGAALRGCDVGVLSSKSEGLPVALLEYGEAGLAVACTDAGDCREVVGDAGRVVPPGDDAGLAEAVIGFLRDAEL
ncbi:MAG: glycosyltransferase, partial [Thermogemmata sp.]